MKLDVACGNNKQPGFTGVDITKEGTQADVTCDLSKFPWPFKDNSVDEVFCSHYIEHTEDLIAFMNELWRITKSGAILTFISPYYTSVRAWQDPTHKRAISESTYFYFDRDWRSREKLLHYPINTDFKIISFDYHYNEDFKEVKGDDLLYASRHFWNVYDDIRATLKKP